MVLTAVIILKNKVVLMYLEKLPISTTSPKIHRNFSNIFFSGGVSPSPPPTCWSAGMGKPVAITVMAMFPSIVSSTDVPKMMLASVSAAS